MTIQPIKAEQLTNRLVIELKAYVNKDNLPITVLMEWLRRLHPSDANDSTLKYRVKNAGEINIKWKEESERIFIFNNCI